jgi:hypothetical protein
MNNISCLLDYNIDNITLYDINIDNITSYDMGFLHGFISC